MGKLKTLAIVQARMGSTRFPGKVMKTINGKPVIELLLSRLVKSTLIDKIILATSINTENDELSEYVKNIGYDVFRGSEEDVLERFYKAAEAYQPETVIRITGDCPLVDPVLVDKVIEYYYASGADYVSNTNPPTFPDGLDTEVFSFQSLNAANRDAGSKYEREHVTPFIRSNKKFCIKNFSGEIDHSGKRWTLDDPSDFEVISNVFNHYYPRTNFTWEDVIKLEAQKPDLFFANKETKRNIGAEMGSGQKLWQRAKQVIPGGNMLLSKRAEMFLPDLWPTYFSKAKGCTAWDLDGNKYIDMSIMGIGTNILGYGHPKVDNAVRRVIELGNMSTFNCPEEVLLAEMLVELHPWAEMVRFARTGGEANAIAIRIARAASGKDKIAFCGYHGWHDWYLAANLGDDQTLDGHLLSGLEPAGVPKNLKGTMLPFTYNKFEELDSIVANHDIGVIKMEVSRNKGPKDNFLQKVRRLATEKNIVLIFDECTSGFRQALGGLHKIYGVEPDMAVFGKALGNGYAITAVIGKRSVMDAAQKTFISSTFWTERIGPAAGLATLKVMEESKSWEVITNTGKDIKSRWVALAEKHGLDIETWGLPALAGFSFNSENNLAYKTYITQEMLKKGCLGGNSVYVSTEHSEGIVDEYFKNLDDIFNEIRAYEDGKDIYTLLDGPVCHAGFKRLN